MKRETFLINSQTFTMSRSENAISGNRMVSLTGTYKLATGESMNRVAIVWVTPAGNAQAEGTYNSTMQTWAASTGDPVLNKYFVTFRIRRSGRLWTYQTPTYTFGL